MLCEYGCDQEAKHQLKNGKWCCKNDYRKCITIRNKISKKLKGRESNRKGITMSDSQKEKISISSKGKKVSQETRNKISKKLKGIKRSKEVRYKLSNIAKKRTGKNNPFFGKTHSEETKKKISRKGVTLTESHKKKISEALKGAKNPFYGKNHTKSTKQKLKDRWIISIENGERCGPNHPNWKGGISNQGYCSVFSNDDFRNMIFERDGYQCLNPTCSKKYKRLTIHHIDYDKKNCDPYNLITLCVSCNSIANFDRKWHENWFNAIVERRKNE